jgi:hypothetical protein
MEEKLHGPYQIHDLRTNGAVRVERAPLILQTFNLRKIFPYKRSKVISISLLQPTVIIAGNSVTRLMYCTVLYCTMIDYFD